MFDLVFLFTGLCAFVPQPTQFDVVLPDAIGHSSVIVVNAQQIVRPPTKLAMTPYCGHRAYELNDHVVRIRGAVAGTVELAPGRVGPVCPEDASELDSYEWVVPMATIVPGSEKIQADYLNISFPASADVKKTVAAKVELTNGRVRSRSLARNGGQIVRWTFNGTAGEKETALSDLVEFRQKELTDNVILEFVSFESETGEEVFDWIELTKDTLPEIVVEVRNQPESRICTNYPEKVKPGTVDYHFGHFYFLLGDKPAPVLPEAGDVCDPDIPESPPKLCERHCKRLVRFWKRYIDPPSYSNPQCPGADADPP